MFKCFKFQWRFIVQIIINYNDKSTSCLFGDAGSAILIEYKKNNKSLFSLSSDGSGFENIIMKHPNIYSSNNQKNSGFIMNGISVFQFLKCFEEVCGLKVPFNISSRRSGDPSCCYADPTKAEKILNWKAKRDLKEMCLSAWNFSNSCEII